jgi:hypothetical protein
MSKLAEIKEKQTEKRIIGYVGGITNRECNSHLGCNENR